jgi:hypothetical protein
MRTFLNKRRGHVIFLYIKTKLRIEDTKAVNNFVGIAHTYTENLLLRVAQPFFTQDTTY